MSGARASAADLRVAMVIQGFHPRIGGAERQLLAVAPRLRARGVDVHVVTRRYPGMAPSTCVDGVPVHRVAATGPKTVASARFTMAAVAQVRRLAPDVIHAHELLSPATVGVLAGALTSTPVVAKVLISGEVRYLRDDRPLGRQRLGLLRRRIDTFVSISDDIDVELAEAGVPTGRRRRIVNGVDTDRYRPPTPDERADARERFGFDNGPVIVAIGRLEPQKNLRQLVDAVAQLRRSHPCTQLALAGTGSQEAALRGAAGDGVRLLGAVDDVPGLLGAADVFALPSLREGLSNSLLEAMACGLPIVASAVGGTAEVLDAGRCGLLVPVGEPDALRDALGEVLDDPARRARLGARAREEVVARYGLDERVNELHDLYRELAS